MIDSYLKNSAFTAVKGMQSSKQGTIYVKGVPLSLKKPGWPVQIDFLFHHTSQRLPNSPLFDAFFVRSKVSWEITSVFLILVSSVSRPPAVRIYILLLVAWC